MELIQNLNEDMDIALDEEMDNPNEVGRPALGYFLTEAAESGDIDELARLLPLCDPKFGNSQALRFAALHGQIECVKLLIPVSDPKAEDSFALRWAVERGHTDIVELLIPVCDVPKVLQTLSENPLCRFDYKYLDEKYVEWQKTAFLKEISTQLEQAPAKKRRM